MLVFISVSVSVYGWCVRQGWSSIHVFRLRHRVKDACRERGQLVVVQWPALCQRCVSMRESEGEREGVQEGDSG